MRAPVQAVLFDYGHTLISYKRPEAALLEAYKEVSALLTRELRCEVPAAEALLAGISAEVNAEIERSYAAERLEEIEIAGLYDASLRRLGLELLPALVEQVMEIEERAWLQGIRLGPDVRPTLQTIRDAGLRIGVVSNASYLPRLMTAQLEHLGIASYFDGLTWSSAVGVRKPHPAIYADALEKLGVLAEAAIFVGDRLREDVQGPQAVGMRAVLLREWRQEADPLGTADAAIDRLGDLPMLLERWRGSGRLASQTYN